MSNEQLKIGLAFSGGGFRAAAFSLGVLAYLDSMKIKNESLLKGVIALSTVSGGTITGARYALGITRGEDLKTIFDSLYSAMTDVDLVDLCLSRLTAKQGWEEGRVRSLINAMADVYDEKLFNHSLFGELLVDNPDIHLKHISFNATEFTTAKQFRFQWSEKLLAPGPKEPHRGIIGNASFNVPVEIASKIRLADIMAASSCFPGGFEPINFPSDFVLPKTEEIKSLSAPKYPIGLMDGGIVDNQGIEPILLAEVRMKRNSKLLPGYDPDSGKDLDLIIVSDVTSPYMEGFETSHQKKIKGWRSLTPAAIFTCNTILLIILGYFLYRNAVQHHILASIILTFLFTLSLTVYLLAAMVKSMFRKMHVPEMFLKPLGKLLRLKLVVYENLLMNRLNSILKMANDVFLKHVRRLNYGKIFSDDNWKNRRIMNAIYELREGEEILEKKIKNKELPDHLIPGPAIQLASKTATSMGTTLWFTKEELEKENMFDTIIACGQFTMCWNLLEYLEKIRKNGENTNAKHQLLLSCEELMLSHWKNFNIDPYWMVKDWKKQR